MLAPENPPEKLREAVVGWSLMEAVQLKSYIKKTMQWMRQSKTGLGETAGLGSVQR